MRKQLFSRAALILMSRKKNKTYYFHPVFYSHIFYGDNQRIIPNLIILKLHFTSMLLKKNRNEFAS